MIVQREPLNQNEVVDLILQYNTDDAIVNQINSLTSWLDQIDLD